MKKRDLIALNRRREIHRRVKFVKDRMRDMPIELAYAEGRRSDLPTRIQKPPDWILAAARIGAEGFNKPIAHLKPNPGKKYLAEDFAELLGYYQAMVCFVHNPPKDVKQQQKDIPELVDAWEPLTKQVTNGFVKFLRRLKRRKKGDLIVPSAAQLQKLNERFRKGLCKFETSDGELRGLEMITTRLYYSIWMFWPLIKNRFNGPAIHLWFREELGQTCSDKTVQAVVTRLRKEVGLHQP